MMRRFLQSPRASVFLFAVAAVLLCIGTIGGARAALAYFSDTYTLRLQMRQIGITLNENGTAVSWRDYNAAADGTWDEERGALLTHIAAQTEGGSFLPGKTYDEVLTVTNSGAIDTYVRVTVVRYWEQDGKKRSDLDPAIIGLHFPADTGWVIDEEASTPERTVLYYTRLLPAGETTPALADTLTVEAGAILSAYTETVTYDDSITGYRSVTTNWAYSGAQLVLEVEAEAVQDHNAEDAIRSVWGREVSVSYDALQLEGEDR